MKRLLCLFLLVIIFNPKVQGQEKILPLSISLNGHYGFIMAHHSSMRYLMHYHVPALEVKLFKRTNGRREWEREFRYPDLGFNFFLADLGNPEELGYGTGIQRYIDFTLNKSEKVQLRLKTGAGLGYITKQFDRIENHKNDVIGSGLNIFFNLRFATVFFTGDRSRMETGIGITHWSNAAFQTPNLGINLVTFDLGLALLAPKPVLNTDSVSRVDRKIRFYTFASFGFSETTPPEGKLYPAFIANVYTGKAFGNRTRFTIGLDLFHIGVNVFKLEQDSIKIKPSQNFQLGTRLGYELILGALSIPVEMGAYIYDPYHPEGPLYHRVGLRYKLNASWIANVALKTHWAKADHMEFGIGYKW